MRFNIRNYNLFHVNNKSLTLIDKTTGEMVLIGKWTYNNLPKYDYRVKIEKVCNPNNPCQVLTWIKIDKRG